MIRKTLGRSCSGWTRFYRTYIDCFTLYIVSRKLKHQQAYYLHFFFSRALKIFRQESIGHAHLLFVRTYTCSEIWTITWHYQWFNKRLLEAVVVKSTAVRLSAFSYFKYLRFSNNIIRNKFRRWLNRHKGLFIAVTVNYKNGSLSRISISEKN